MTFLLALAVTIAMADPPRPRPAALVLGVQGKVVIKTPDQEDKPARIKDRLYPGQHLAVPADGRATIAILGVGAKECLKPGTEATITPKGCVPPESVAERTEQAPAVAKTMRGVDPLSPDHNKAGVMIRGVVQQLPAIAPIDVSTIATTRPELAWPPDARAKSYRVRLRIAGSDQEMWRVEVHEPRLPFPAEKPELARGKLYRWEVTVQDSRRVATGLFSVASNLELKQISDLQVLAASADSADLLAAAVTLNRVGCYAESILAFEKLAKRAPEEALYREWLVELYRLAGRPSGIVVAQ